MKKTILFRHIFLTVFMLLFSFFLVSCGKKNSGVTKRVVIQDTKEDGDFKLIKIDNKWYIGGLVEAEKEEIVIPSTIDVYGIWKKAFCDKKEYTEYGNPSEVKDYYNDTLKKVTIEKQFKSIGEEAFYGCRKLEKVVLPESITELCDVAFLNCKSLEEIKIPNKVARIGAGCFFGCTNLKEIDLSNHDKLTYIGEGAFANCYSLTKALLPENITVIMEDTFLGCRSIKKMIIPKKVTIIEERAFNCCECDFIILGKIKKIGSVSFAGVGFGTYIYFKGSKDDWSKIVIYHIDPLTDKVVNKKVNMEDFKNYTCFYSEKRPTSDSYNYWHYVDGEPSIWS